MIAKRLGEIFALITLCCVAATFLLPSANAEEQAVVAEAIVAPESASEAVVVEQATEPAVTEESPVQSDTERSRLQKAKAWMVDKYHRVIDKYHSVKDRLFDKE